MELADMFPDEPTAVRWFEKMRWPDGPQCPHCGSDQVSACKNSRPMPWRCKACRKHFSVRTGTDMAHSNLKLRKWAFGIYLTATSLKGVSSMRLHRDLKITQKSAWFMAHRIRDALGTPSGSLFAGPVEVDESYFGGKEKNKPVSQRRKAGRGPAGKTAVVGAKDRATGQVQARAVNHADGPTLQGFVKSHTSPGATVYTDEARAYLGLRRSFNHESVKHSVSEYVRGQAHTNGIESFWSLLKRGYHGTFHHFSAKHMQRYIDEFATRQGLREADTIDLMGAVVSRMIGRRLTYKQLIAN
ncbi:MAG: IS1595 family transposase [Gammaproteobacteria bacterium]|nr:IS1595 family transposase [Gammaproteobacteria bacterium]